MTVHRTAGSIEAVLLSVLHELSDAELEAATQKKRASFYPIADPSRREQLHLKDAIALDRALAGRGLAPRFLPMMQAAIEAPAGDAAEAGQLVTRAMVELGELAAVFERAGRDGRYSPEERRRLAKEADDLVRVATEAREKFEPSLRVAQRG